MIFSIFNDIIFDSNIEKKKFLKNRGKLRSLKDKNEELQRFK